MFVWVSGVIGEGDSAEACFQVFLSDVIHLVEIFLAFFISYLSSKELVQYMDFLNLSS